MAQAPNLQDPAFLENPFPFYEIGRQMSPLFIPAAGMWMAFRYSECVGILKDNESWLSGIGPAETADAEPTMLSSNPPRHTRLRGLVNQAFTPRMIEQLEPRLRQIAGELLDEATERGECDLVEALAYPLPVIAIAEILGVDPARRQQFKDWSDRIVAGLGGGGAGGPAASEEMREYFGELCAERRARPRNDLISGLVQAEMEGDRLSLEELLQMLVLLLVAGNETTTNLIGNAMLEFMAHPVELAKVEADRSLIPSALEEVLRVNSPVQATVRRAARDIDVSGQRINEGQRVVVWLAAANRDPEQFPDPLTFDVARTPNRHISFGMGIHFCLGAPLARLEAKIAWEELLKRGTNFRRTTDAPLPRVPTFIMRGVTSLPVAFDPR